MWDEEDGFYYDVLRLPDGGSTRLKVRSMVGLLPHVRHHGRRAVAAGTGTQSAAHFAIDRCGACRSCCDSMHPTGRVIWAWASAASSGLVNPDRLRRILARMLDEDEFLGPHGIRALSRYHAEHPYVFWVGGQEYRVNYLPAESDTGMFGGNSNWRGPVWMPVNALIIRALLHSITSITATASKSNARPGRAR